MSQNACLLKKFIVPSVAALCMAVLAACGNGVYVGRSAPPVKTQKPAEVKTPPVKVDNKKTESPAPTETKPEVKPEVKPEIKDDSPDKPKSNMLALPKKETVAENKAEADQGTPPTPPARPRSSPVEDKSNAAPSPSPYKLDLSFGGYGIGVGLFDTPVAVAVDDQENIYVVDQGNSRIQKFDRFGIFQFTWGKQGLGDGEFTEETVSGSRILKETGEFEFNKPVGILLDTDQSRSLIRITVVDSLNYRLQRFLLTKNQGDHFPGQGQSSDQFPNNSLDVFLKLTGDHTNPVQHDAALQAKYTSDGSKQVILDPVYIRKADKNMFAPFVWGKLGYTEGLLNLPSYLSVDEEGFLYVTDTENMRVQGFYVTPANPDTDATFFRDWGKDISLPQGAGRLNSPTAIAFDNSGFGGFLVLDKLLDGSYNIQRFDRQGTFLGVFATSGDKEGKFKHPVGIAVNPFDNTVFVSDKGRRKVMTYNSKGEFLYEFGGEELADPRGIAVLRNNYVYVTDASKNMVYRYVPQ